jgi:hypothetical protein
VKKCSVDSTKKSRCALLFTNLVKWENACMYFPEMLMCDLANEFNILSFKGVGRRTKSECCWWQQSCY